jgi:plastocyanin
MFFSKKVIIALLQSGAALAATVNVKVGGNKALVFSPTSVTANPGDTVRFQFIDQNHTATAGTPGQGCTPSGKFNSGFVPIAAGTNPGSTFDVAITDKNPITVYCAQAQHCQVGMVMVINPTPTVSFPPFN